MSLRATLAVWSCLLCSPRLAETAQPVPATLTEREYVAELDRLIAGAGQLDERRPDAADRLLREIPGQFHVATAARAFEVSTDWLSSALRDWRREPGAARRAEILNRLRLMRADAASLDPPADAALPRAALASILAEPEFRGVHGPTWFDRLRQRLNNALMALLGRLIRRTSISTVTNVLIYALMLLAAVLVALWLHRSWRRGVLTTDSSLSRPETDAATWEEWLASARAAAASGDWTGAIRFAYWCGISLLEGQRVWRPDPSRTPREYLRSLPATSEQRPPLLALSGLLEGVWYGGAPAGAREFEDALASLKALGCPSL